MPFSFSDISKSLSDIFAKPNGLLGNPFTVAYILGIIICIIVIFLMRDDDINNGKIKLFKLFIYSSIFAACLIISQNTILIKDIENKRSLVMTDKVINGGDMVNTNGYVGFKPDGSTSVMRIDPMLTTNTFNGGSMEEQVKLMIGDD